MACRSRGLRWHIGSETCQSEETALERRDAVAEELGLWLFGGPRPTDDDQVTLVEISVSDAAMQVSDDEVAAAFERLLRS